MFKFFRFGFFWPFSIAGFIGIIVSTSYCSVRLTGGDTNPLRWWWHWHHNGKHRQVALDGAGDEKPGHHPIKATEAAVGKAVGAVEKATSRPTTRAAGTLEALLETHERHKAEAATMPHPIIGGLDEIKEGHIKDGWGHVWNGAVKGIREKIPTVPRKYLPAVQVPATQPSTSATTVPVVQPVPSADGD